jgi:anti-anti-sigma factor
MSVPPSVSSHTDVATAFAKPFDCSWSSGANAAWVHVAGELDLASSPRLERTLGEAQQDSSLVVLDPRGLTFIDCAGIHVIVESAGRARSEGGWLMLMVASPLVERLLTLTGGADLVTIFDADLDLEPPEPEPQPTGARRWRPGRLGRAQEVGRRGELRAVRDDTRGVGFPPA